MKRILLIIAIISTTFSYAQTRMVQKFGIREGLSSNYILSITQDKYGYMWFATLDGLSCFDGNKFSSFYHDMQNRVNSISGNALNVVYADKEEPIIWIGTQRDGLDAFNYESGAITIYKHKDNDKNCLSTNDITNIIDAGNGKLWVSTYWQGVELFDKHANKFTHYNTKTVKGMPCNGTWSMAYDKNGHLYIGQVDHGLTIINIKAHVAKNYKCGNPDAALLPDNDIRSIYLDKYGQLWLGTHKGLALFDTNTNSFIPLGTFSGLSQNLLQSNILSIKEIGKYLWVATEFNGVFVIKNRKYQPLSPNSFPTVHYTEGFNRESLSCSSVYSIYDDSFGNIWLGTWGGGANFISHLPQMFNNIEYGADIHNDETLTNKTAQCVCTDLKGRVWVGTDGGGINIFQDGHRIAALTRENGKITDNVINSSFRDKMGNLWFGTYSGWIYKVDAASSALRKLKLLNGDYTDIRCIYENHNHQICIGSSSGLFILDAEALKVKAHYDTRNSQLPELLIRAICQDKYGRYWIGTFGGGLAIMSPDMQKAQIFNRYNKLCSNTINHIICGNGNNMWIATDCGVVRFNTDDFNRYKYFQDKEGLHNINAHALAKDRKGNLWVSTNKGLSCITTSKDKIYNFTNASDIGFGEFCGGAVTTGTDGVMYFGYNGGLCFFNPADMKPDFKLPPVQFTQIEVLKGVSNETDKFISIANREKVYLEHDENTFSIGFNVRDYALKGHVYYAYRLKALNDNWFEVGTDQEVAFRNLPYGKYTLEVKARINDKEWSGTSASIVICINPPLWLSWWAKATYFIIFIFIIGFILFLYRRDFIQRNMYKMEQANREKEIELNNERLRFYTNIAHELRTPLTLIIGPLDDLLRSTSLTDTIRHKIEMIYKNANRLLNLVNQILEFRKAETQNRKLKITRSNLSQTVKEIGLKFKEANKNPDLQINIDIDDNNLVMYYDKEVVTTILDNLLSNAIKYTPSGNIILYLSTKRNLTPPKVDICVIDSGYGIEAKALPHLFDRFYQVGGEHQSYGTGIGLALVKSLSTLHKGTINVNSEIGKGSVFTFSLDIDNTYPDAEHEEEDQTEDKPIDTDTTAVTTQSEDLPVLLVVEDNHDISNYIKESFAADFDVAIAYDGKEGLNKALQLTPDIIVSDVMMPEMDGIELCNKLKNDIRTSHIPIILLTAKDTIENKEEGYQAGADSYITKPFSSNLLHSRINNLLDSRKKLSEKKSLTQLANKKEQLNIFINQHDNEFIEHISTIINDNLAEEKLDIGFLAEHMNMSSSSLYRKMKALTGLSTNEYIHKVKMEIAEKMLIERKYSISEIAFKLGFSSPSYFRQCFKDEYKMSPSDYLKKLTEKSDEEKQS
jgi:signal transduction histidine kinase/ligand-binding sensor domain-containing protein/CheY-like chemotaxis protein/AraC-like DNA-binding protein